MATSSLQSKRLNWKSLLRSLGVRYMTEGKNTKPGCLSTKCPLCGFSDPSEHAVINPKTNRWFCWRNKSHRGSAVDLVKYIANCSVEQANQFISDAVDGELLNADQTVAEMIEVFKNRNFMPKMRPHFEELQMPGQFKPLWEDRVSRSRFMYHIYEERGFYESAEEVCRRYDLHYCLSDQFAHRIIIPFRHGGKLIGWTARSILKKPRLRYDNFPPGMVTKRIIFNADLCRGGKILFITEGPFDCMKVDFFARRMKCNAVATLGTNTIAAQITELHYLIRKYDRAVVLFDPKAESQALSLMSELVAAGRPVAMGLVPDGAEDPGVLTPRQVTTLVKRWLKRT